MQLLRATIQGLKAFAFSQIQSITIDPVDKMVIIVGCNGSGKTSLLKELQPYPTGKHLYHKDGYKQLVFEHEGKEHILTMNIGNKHSKYSYTIDGEEMNGSGTITLQEELVQQHLYYTPYTHKTVSFSTSISNMTPSERKLYCFKSDVFDISFLLDMYKSVTSRVKQYQHTENHLIAKKTKLEQELIPEEQYVRIKEEQKKIREELQIVDRLMIGLKYHIEHLENEKNMIINKVPNIQYQDIQTFQQDIQSYCKSLLPILPVIQITQQDIEDPNGSIRELSVQLSQRTEQIQAHKTILYNLKNSLEEIEKKIQTTQDNQISKLSQELQNLQKAYKELAFNPDIPYSQDPVSLSKAVSDFLSLIDQDIHLLAHKTVSTLWTPEQYDKVVSVLQKLYADIKNYTQEEQYITQSIRQLEEEIRSLDVVPNDCSRLDCQVLQSYRTNKESKLSELARKQHALADLKKVTTRVRYRFDILREKYQEQKSYVTSVKKILSVYTKSPIYKYMSTDKLLQYIYHQPYQIRTYLESIVLNSHFKIQQDKIQSMMDTISKEIEKYNVSDSIHFQYLVEKRTELQLQQNFYEKELEKTEKEIYCISQKIQMIEQYLSIKNTLDTKLQYASIYYTYIQLHTAIKFHKEYYQYLSNYYTDKIQKCVEYEKIVQEQEQIRTIIYKEILPDIEKIQKEKTKLTLVQKALSPQSGIPYMFISKYINKIIHNTNYFLNYISHYTYEILPLLADEELNFKFTARVNGVDVPELYHLSRGQKELLDIAWNLSVMYYKQVLSQYPLFLDEIGTGLDSKHHQLLITFFSSCIESQLIKQIFMVHHQTSVITGFDVNQIICLNEHGIPLPQEYNQNVQITYR